METIKFSSLHDFERFAKDRMDSRLFEHLMGQPRA